MSGRMASVPEGSGKLIGIGFGNVVAADKVVAIIGPESAPMRRYKEEARQRGMLVDATQGRKTRAIIVTSPGHVILAAVAVETIAQRWRESKG